MKRILSIFLSLSLLCGVLALVSCGGEGSTTTSSGTQATIGTGQQTDGTTVATGYPDPGTDPDYGSTKPAGFEDVNFDGKVFTFEVANSSADWNCYEVVAVDENATDGLSMAITRRNDTMAELYNCGIAEVSNADGILASDFATENCRVDVLATQYNLSTKAAGQYYDLYTLGLDLSNPWWDQGFVQDVTVDGKIFGIVGDFSLTSFDATWVLYFNKEVLDQSTRLRGVDLYELVDNGEWTIDKFIEIMQKAKQEDGDQTMTTGSGDIYGFVSSSFGIRGLYYGAGGSYAIKTDDAAGNTTFTHGFNNNASLVAEQVINIYADDAATITDYRTVGSQITNGLALFAPETLDKARNWSEAGLENFGLLPHPVYSTEQLSTTGYKHFVDNHMIYVSVPKTINYDLSIIADFLELYGFHSRYIVYPEFLNLYKYNWTNSEEDARMLDIILDSRTYDLGYLFNWGSVDSEFFSGVESGQNVIATLGAELGGVIEQGAIDYKNTIKENN